MKKLQKPPKFFPSLLRQVIWEDDQESLPGDFEETYHAITREEGSWRACGISGIYVNLCRLISHTQFCGVI